MNFLVSGTHISAIYLMAVGFVVGILGGFFGVGGSFLAGPALFAAGMPMHFVVGTNLSQIVGSSFVAARRHQAIGNVDIKLAMIMVAASIGGVETGAQLIQVLKRQADVDFVVGIGFIVVLIAVSTFMGYESIKTIKAHNLPVAQPKQDVTAFAHISKRIQRFHLPPMISLPDSGIEQISLWIILGVAFAGGVLSGFLGGGAGYIRMPLFVFLLGVPTHIAVGTDLFEIIISAGYGAFTHAIKGNVDIMVALVILTGAAVGAQIGAHMTSRFQGPKIRLAFAPLPLIGAVLVIYSLMTGHHFN